MRHYFIQQNHTPGLTLFFAGWGMDERPFMDCRPADRDLLVCYDYRSLDVDFTLLQGYQGIRVVAWSMGVWAASVVLQQVDLPISDRIAMNGTPTPIDDRTGIAQVTFQKTEEGLNDSTLIKFFRRMCGGRQPLEAFLARRPQRPVAELKEELQLIREQVQALPVPCFPWNRAVIGTEDLIFTADCQRKAWSTGVEVREYDIPHYSAAMLRELLCPSGTGLH